MGGNAMTNAEGRARVEEQIAAAEVAMEAVADLLANDIEAVITPATVSRWATCWSRTSSPLPSYPRPAGLVRRADPGDARHGADGRAGRVAAAPWRAAPIRDGGDPRARRPRRPGSTKPTKPIGESSRPKRHRLVEHGETWRTGREGLGRVVASPEPLEIIDAPAVQALVDGGFVVVANGGGGIPVVRDGDGNLGGVEAVIDKDLGAALLARSVEVDVLVIATDVPHAVLHYGTPEAADSAP